jgi:predicted secreted protein
MNWVPIIAIYALFWVLSAFVILPLGIRSHEELGLEKIPGQADGAPGNFRPKIVILRTTMLSSMLFGLLYLWLDRPAQPGFPDQPNALGLGVNYAGDQWPAPALHKAYRHRMIAA